jgi:aminoglycoside N3'-acetyltransferase
MINQAALVEGLEQLGIRPESCIMAHGSLSRFGYVEGGAETVVAALCEASGPGGAVIVPSFRDAIRSEHFALRECESICPQSLCPSRERGYTGILGEAIRQESDALRSCHPTHSWVGIGRSAAGLLDGHRNSLTPCGTDSPFFRLMQLDGTVLLLGVDVSSLTNIHAVEDARNVPYLSAIDRRRRHATYTTSGRRIQYRYPAMLHEVMRSAGILRSSKVGKAICHAMSARELGNFLWVITEDDPWCLVLRPLKGQYNPEADAMAKTRRMLAAWQRKPDPEAWRCLLEESLRPRQPAVYEPAKEPQAGCPAYRGPIRGYHRCAANDLPPWERFEDFPPEEPGVATCGQCNWPLLHGEGD